MALDVEGELGPAALIVVAGSTAYRVNIDAKTASELTWPADFIEFVPGQKILIVGNGLWFEAIGPSGAIWQSRRVSWDGMRSLRCDGQAITGEAYNPMGPPDWLPFKLHVASGDVEGGSYNGPP